MHPTASQKVMRRAASLGTAGDCGPLSGRPCPGLQIPGGRLAGVKPVFQVHTLRRRCPLSDSRDRKDSTWNVEGSTSSFLGREASPLSRLGGSDNNYPEKDISERRFRLDKTWKNDSRMYPKCDFRDERPMKPSGSIPPLPRDYQIHRSGHLHHYTLHKELSHAPARPCAFGSYDLRSVPAILLPAAASLNGRNPFSTEVYKNRTRVNNRTCSLFTIGANQKSQSCVVTDWSHWSGCAQPCQRSRRVRQRHIEQEPRNSADPCPSLEEQAGCMDYQSNHGEICTQNTGPAFITTREFGKGRTKPDIYGAPLYPGFCMEYKMESLTTHCTVENRPHTLWMQYLREGYTVCVACQPPAMRNHSGSCQGDGQESNSEELLHWQAVGNSGCRGTWKKVQRTAYCSCPHVHSFLFI